MGLEKKLKHAKDFVLGFSNTSKYALQSAFLGPTAQETENFYSKSIDSVAYRIGEGAAMISPIIFIGSMILADYLSKN